MRSPRGMNCCSPQQEALLFSSSGSSKFECLDMSDFVLVHQLRVKRGLLQLLAPTWAVCGYLPPPLLEGMLEGRSDFAVPRVVQCIFFI